jgi:hypothetical protein
MINKYAEALPRRVSPSSESATSKRERSILPPGVEGKLLVPDVKLKVRTGSSASITPRNRSPLSAPSELGDDETASNQSDTIKSPAKSTKRPVPESEHILIIFVPVTHRTFSISEVLVVRQPQNIRLDALPNEEGETYPNHHR